MKYLLLQSYLDHTLTTYLDRLAEELVEQKPRFSPNRAKEVAAAVIWNQWVKEWSHLETYMHLFPDLYDALLEQEERDLGVRAVMVEHTGTRTLLDDAYIFKGDPLEERLEGMLESAI